MEYFSNERKDIDIPFYNYKPTKISVGKWLVILLITFIGFIIFSLGFTFTKYKYLNVALNFLSLPVLGYMSFRVLAKGHTDELFRKVKFQDILTVIYFVIISIFVVTGVAVIFSKFFPMAENPAAITSDMENALSIFLIIQLSNLIQLLGEEFLAIYPFLFLMQVFYNNFKMDRKKSIVLALIISSLIFGALHLPTYNWNIIQSLFVIGIARVLLTMSYIRTRNIWVSYLVHLFYDGVLLTLAFFLT